MKRHPLALLVFIGASLVTASQSVAGQSDAGADPIQAYLQPLISDQTLAGAVTLISSKDKTIYQKALGYRDLAARVPMKAGDLFWIASTTKPMTVTALMMLVDEGKVNVDDPVEKYLPEFKGQMVRLKGQRAGTVSSSTNAVGSSPPVVPADHPILIREILSHTSGLPFKSAAQPGALDLLSLKDAVHSFAAEPLIFQPGTDSRYSNEGLNTAARIIEVVSGMPYEEFMQARLFTPLGMNDTTFWPSADQIKRLARTYKVDDQTRQLKDVPVNQLTYPLDDKTRRYPMPAGGLFSTAEDVAKFARMILNGGAIDGKRYISERSLHMMTTEQNLGLGGSSYGFGWAISRTGFGHGGAFNNTMEIDAVRGRILIFMVQQDGVWGTERGKAIMPTLEKLADQIVEPTAAQNTAAPGADR